MGLFRGRTAKNEAALLKRAALLVGAATLHASGSYMPLFRQFPVMQEVDAAHWDRVVTVAAVYVAMEFLNDGSLDDASLLPIASKVFGDLNDEDPNGWDAYEQCKKCCRRDMEAALLAGTVTFLVQDAVGRWCVSCVLRRHLDTHEEYSLARTVGIALTEGFLKWYDDLAGK